MRDRHVIIIGVLVGLFGGSVIWWHQYAMSREPWYQQWRACVAQLGPPVNMAEHTGPSSVAMTDSGWVLHGTADGIDGQTVQWTRYPFAYVAQDGAARVVRE